MTIQSQDPVAAGGDPRPGMPAQSRTADWQAIRFHGSGFAFFKIWIVNLVLTILTLGIYSAWATVRQRRYLWGSTEVAGSRFDFHGRPLAILVGRIIALVLLLAWTQGQLLHWALPVAALAVVVLLLPWFALSALRFKLRNTSLRNLRFDFTAGVSTAYRELGKFLLYGGALLAAMGGIFWLSLGGLAAGTPIDTGSVSGVLLAYGLVMLAFTFLYPLFVCALKRFSVNYASYGDQRFQVTLRDGDFVASFWLTILITLVLGSLAMFAIYAVVSASMMDASGEGAPPSPAVMIASVVLGYAVMGLAFAVANAFWQARVFNLVYGGLALDTVAFRSRLKFAGLCKILVTNMLLVIVTLGFGYPWAVVRMVRYKLECLDYRGDISHFSGSSVAGASAVGDETGAAFDLDFGFG